MDIPYEKQFHFRDGTSIGSLEELKRKIESIGYQEFYHHVNNDKNDFANWVRYVIKDAELADDLQRVSSIVETVEIINDCMHPRPITSSRADAQSRIEQNVLPAMPADPAETPLVVEESPRTIPAPSARGNDALLRIIEEPIPGPVGAAVASDAGASNILPAVSQELFGTEQRAQAQLATERAMQDASSQPSGQLPSGPSSSATSPAASPGGSASQDNDATRLIVKDFMYGLVFGLIVGLILGRILSF